MKAILLFFLASACLAQLPHFDSALPLVGSIKEVRKENIEDIDAYRIVWNEAQKPRYAFVEFFETSERKKKIATLELTIRKHEIYDEQEQLSDPFNAKPIGHEWSSFIFLDKSLLESTEIEISIAAHAGSVSSVLEILEHYKPIDANKAE
ncbi:MAG: hypothetical protein ACSHX4_05265 [Opitutaceae bacterium]